MNAVNAFYTVRDLLFHFNKVDPSAADENIVRKVNRFSLAIFSAGIHQDAHDFRPDILEAELEELRSQIEALAVGIAQLNPWAAEVARQEAERARLVRTGMSEDLAISRVLLGEASMLEPIDQVAISSLNDLNDALKKPIEALIHKGRSFPTGKGKKPDLVAREIAYMAGWAMIAIGTQKPSYWRAGSIYAKLCEALFHEFGLKADSRRACEWALSELEKNGKL